MIRITNNMLALGAMVLITISLLCNYYLYKETIRPEEPTGRVVNFNAYVQICINKAPNISVSCNPSATAYYWYACIVTANDTPGQNMTYSDSSALFDIGSTSGLISFVPTNDDVGNYTVNITVDDGMGCDNSLDMDFLNITVIKNNPPFVISYQPNATQEPDYPIVYVDENSSLQFNVSFMDELNETVNLEWELDGIGYYLTTGAENSTTFIYVTDFLSAGLHDVAIRLWDQFNVTYMHNWTVNVTNVNRPPYWNSSIPHQRFFKNQVYGTFYLEDYAIDPDPDDTLFFNVTYLNPLYNIEVVIYPASNNFVVMWPAQDFVGAETVRFNVYDNWGAGNASNVVWLTVMEPPLDFTPSGGAGGGGGGGFVRCIESWFCEQWSICWPNGTRYRRCIDLNHCGTELRKPPEEESCEFIKECYDGVQNQGEEGVDCGGPCPPCETCFDRVQNQGETGIDCGGPCPPCEGEEGPFKERPEALPEPEMIVQRIREGFVGVALIATMLIIILLAVAYKTGKPYVVRAYKHWTKRLEHEKLAAVGTIDIERIVADALARLDKVEKMLDTAQPSKAFNELSSTLKEYIKSIFQLDYQCTYSDLRLEVTKRSLPESVRSSIMSALRRMADMEYGGYKMERAELRSLAHELRRIVTATPSPYKPKAVSTKPKFVSQKKASPELVVDIDELMQKALELLHHNDIDGAKKTYQEITKAYNKMSEEQKKKYYIRIRKLYDEITYAGGKS
jgi:hypothetical protein